MTAEGRAPVVLLPAGLRERVLAASRQARAAGHPTPLAAEISPDEAFSRAADALYGLLCALGDADWRRPVLRDLDVQGLVGHLIGVEDDVHRCLSGDPRVAGADHVESTQPAAARQAGRPPSVPDASTLTLMTGLAARLLPYGAARTGLRETVSVHLVLTGAGGGTWDVPVGSGARDPVCVSIVTDAVGFCRLAAGRVVPADLDLHVT